MADNESPQPKSTPPAPPIRSLMINLVFSMFVSIVVFSIASYAFLVPHMFDQKRQLEAMKEQVRQLDERARLAEAADEEAQAGDEAATETAAADQAGAEGDAAPAQDAPGEPAGEGTGIAAAE